MAAAVLSNLKGALTHGGARPSLFEITVSKPTAVSGSFDNMATHWWLKRARNGFAEAQYTLGQVGNIIRANSAPTVHRAAG